ncbi:MAG: acetate--CoA ligase [Cytophagales bacterium]|nr:acetate--CoA ligase [Cytophagales bacterium]MDW8383170.1 acetate--CoA ligase [Flammeovirgaceae bacterium]
MKRISSLLEYLTEYEKSRQNPEAFWAEKAESFVWHQKWHTVLNPDWNFINHNVKWFEGAKLNITENCIDRHLAQKAHYPAFIWEPNQPDEPSKYISYQELHEQVCKAANVLKRNGIQKGDRVCLYMPMIPELAIAVLACARIGAIHSVVFGGFSATALAGRIEDAKAKMVITSDSILRGNKIIPAKATVDEALSIAKQSIETVLVVRRSRESVKMESSRDKWWHEEIQLVDANCPAESMDAEDMLFILYTSGSTGKPKGVVHTTAGYMVWAAYTFLNTFQYQDGDVFFCTADIGWITGHTYVLYGALLNGATSVMFEGIPTFPDAGRFWQIVEKHKVNIFYTAPTAIRSLMGFSSEYVEKYDLSSLRVLGSVGEPINQEAWHWFHEKVGKGRCPIADTWWQTETGGHMITPIAGITPQKPCYATLPLPGVFPVLLDEKGNELHGNSVEGVLCIKFPHPAIFRTTYGDHQRCIENYFKAYPGYYFTGDGAKRDEDGYYRIIGRVDDVINVSGHRIGTAEVEDAINKHVAVIESAVVGYPHDIKGQGIFAYVICDESLRANLSDEELQKEIINTVSKEIGPIAKPDKILFVPGLPKTRSGKIMRRILRKIAEGDTSNLGDTSTLLDPQIVEIIKQKAFAS